MGVLVSAVLPKNVQVFAFGVVFVFMIFSIIPGITIAVRRLHDSGRSGWWLLLCAVLNGLSGASEVPEFAMVGSALSLIGMALAVWLLTRPAKPSKYSEQEAQLAALETKEPAEEKKQFLSCFADVFLNEKSHGFSFVFDTRIQRTEIGNSTKEDTADQDP